MTTLEGTSYSILRDQVFGDTWEAVPDAGEHIVVVEPPLGRSVAIALGVALSWDGDPVDVEWFIKAPNGSYQSLGTSNIAGGAIADAIYFLTNTVGPPPLYAMRSTAEIVHSGGALCVTVSGDGCGIYVAGWVI